MSFALFNLDPKIASGVKAMGYISPTPIQRRALPEVLAGRDVMGLAQTGTGKTAVFVLPVLERLLKKSQGRIRALVIAPTRELAEQINTAFLELGRQTHLRSAAIYGGVPMPPQVKTLRAGAEIVVACPGRLLDHIGQGTVNLSGVEVLVLDEADRMLDMGFLPDIRKILRYVPARQQTLLFSATMPEDIRRLAEEILRAPVRVRVSPAVPARTVSHALYPVEQHRKTALLLELLRSIEAKSVLVFARTKHRAKRIGHQLERAGYRAVSLQGNLSQNMRQSALEGFRNGSYQVLVATDIASRGIDVSGITHVINYDMPNSVDAYTHRIGRTGRAERSGDAFTFITSDDAAMVRSIERVLGEKVESRVLKGFDYRKPAPARDAGFVARPVRSPRPGNHGRRRKTGKTGAIPGNSIPRAVAAIV